jgi:hypothetical protein
LRSLSGNNATVSGDEATEDEGADSGELDEDVDGWARGILKGVSDGVANNGSGVFAVALADSLDFSVLGGSGEMTGLDVLLGVVPSATRVGGREGNLDTRDDGTGQNSAGGSVGEEQSGKEWGEDDESAWSDHLSEGSVGGDGDALLVVWVALLVGLDEWNLSVDLSDHVLSGIADSGHGQSGEPVWEHSADEKASESVWLEDVDGVDSLGLFGCFL